MNKLGLIIGAGVRERGRWARQHLYAILILSPLVVGMTYATVARVASYAEDDLRLSFGLALVLAALAEATLVGLSLSRASTEIYHLRTPETFLDALPVAHSTHLHAALAGRIARTLAAGAVVLVARSLFGGGTFDLSLVAALALWVILTACLETLAALQWIHWGHTRERRQLLAAAAVLLPTVALAGMLLLRIVAPALAAELSDARLLPCVVVWCAGLYALMRHLHAGWRASDIEYAKRLQAGSRRSLFRTALVNRFGSPAVAAQIARDLQLTLRAFSSSVYVALIIASLWVALLVVSLTTGMIPLNLTLPPAEGGAGWLDATLLAPVVCAKAVCVFAVMSLSAILPVLVAYQLPHLWLERATGATGGDMWQAKLWYARLVALPAPVVVWAAAVACGAVPAFYVLPLLLECVWLWWLMSSLIGGLAFELPEQPGLSLILMIFAGLSAGLLTAWLWPLGLLAGMAISQMSERGPHCARVLLLTEGD
ncbi:MAG TPA: hypothetical protein VNA19_05980 [Pyrinomonadaceae bacterium]|nr:hypothetical protein [Pyrinomonadaceae bacterium]